MTKEEAKEFIIQSIKDDVDVAEIANAISILEQPTKKLYERFLPCTCGCNRRSEWTFYNNNSSGIRLVCNKCGNSANGKTRAEAKRNWNIMIRNSEKL